VISALLQKGAEYTNYGKIYKYLSLQMISEYTNDLSSAPAMSRVYK